MTVYGKAVINVIMHTLAKTDGRCPLEERPLTIREYARIQTFDDTYEFVGGMSSQYNKSGMLFRLNSQNVWASRC
jgi:site-specific DNA-cytosine methylase